MPELIEKDITVGGNEGLEQAIAGLKMDLAKKDAALRQAAQAIQSQQQETAKLKSERDGLEGYARVTEHTAIQAALAAEEQRAQNLKRDLAAAVDTANSSDISKFTEAIADAKARQLRLQEGKDKIEEEMEADRRRREAAARQPPQQPRQAPQPQVQNANADPFETAIAPLPASHKDWLRQHKDKGYIKPGSQQIVDDRLLSAYYAAKGAGFREDSPQFTQHMDKILGHGGEEAPFAAASERFSEAPNPPRQQPPAPNQAPARQPPPQRQAQAPAAPPGRSSGGGTPRSARVNLTPAEQQAAARMQMTEDEYIQGLQQGIARGKYPANYLQR